MWLHILKKMLCCLVVTAITVHALTITPTSHPGGTDGSGGHYDHSTGEYHYHHGFHAHQHPGGVCPYRDKKPEYSTHSNTSKRKKSVSESSLSQSTPRENGNSLSDKGFIITLLLIFSPHIIAGLCILTDVLFLRKQRKKKFEQERTQIMAEFKGMSCRERAHVPHGVLFGPDFWPEKIGGVSYMVHVNFKTGKYHTPQCRYSRGLPVSNIFSLSRFSPCLVCNPMKQPAAPKWLSDYRSYIQTKKEYAISDPDLPGIGELPEKTNQQTNI